MENNNNLLYRLLVETVNLMLPRSTNWGRGWDGLPLQRSGPHLSSLHSVVSSQYYRELGYIDQAIAIKTFPFVYIRNNRKNYGKSRNNQPPSAAPSVIVIS